MRNQYVPSLSQVSVNQYWLKHGYLLLLHIKHSNDMSQQLVWGAGSIVGKYVGLGAGSIVGKYQYRYIPL